jgi:hypothetical protein
MLGEKVGGLYYEVSLDTAQLIKGQREANKALQATKGGLESLGRGCS